MKFLQFDIDPYPEKKTVWIWCVAILPDILFVETVVSYHILISFDLKLTHIEKGSLFIPVYFLFIFLITSDICNEIKRENWVH